MNDIGKLRNMTSIYLSRNDKMLLLYRQGSKVVNNMWIASAGGHFDECKIKQSPIKKTYRCLRN